MADRLLTPPEAVLLIKPSSSAAPLSIQAALLALLGMGHVTISEKSGLLRKRMLVVRSNDEPLPMHLAAVRNALRDYRPNSDGLDGNQVIHALQRRFGLGYGRYVRDHLAPGLAERGLLTAERRKFLGLIPYMRYARTARGEAIARPLDRLIEAADGLKQLIKTDPERALHLVRSAGVLLIMSAKARSQLPALRKLIEQRGEDSPALTFAYVSDEPEAEWDVILDIGDIVISEGALDLLESIDAVGDVSAGDGGSSDGGDGGGGD